MMYPSQPPTEQPIYTDTQVTVTTARFVSGSTMYPVRGITAVQPVVIPANRSGAVWTAILGGIVLVLGAGNGSGLFGFFGFVMFATGIFMAVKAKPTYIVRVWTAGGQVDAVSSHDGSRIQQIVAALHRATTGG